jgi:hypothetical protein
MSRSSWIENTSKISKRLIWRDARGVKKRVSLGRCSVKVAKHFQVRLNELLEYSALGVALSPELVKWLNGLDPDIQKQLSTNGLIGNAHGYTLEDWIEYYRDNRKQAGVETRIKWANTAARLIDFLGADTMLSMITPSDAEEFREELETNGKNGGGGLAPATVNKHCSIASQFFNGAIKKRVITENCFADIETCNLPNKAREYFVSVEEADKLMEALPSWQLRTFVALGRYGGLRSPSESVRLRWEDVHFGNAATGDCGYMLVPNIKTRHNASVDDYRKVPLFPELLPYMEEAWEQSPEGAEYVLQGYQHIDENRFKSRKLNLRTPVVRALRNAGLTQWPRVLQNLRSTRETELCSLHPLHVVVYWLNNSERMAQKHYLQITDDHLKAGCGLATQDQAGANEGAEPSLIAPHVPSAKTQTLQKKAFPVIDHQGPSVGMPQMGDEGLYGTRI